MITTNSSKETRDYLEKLTSIAFVPTMGALHHGHLELIRLAKKYAKHVVVSIFVNPTQFNNPQDLEKYPRTIEEDLKLLENEKVDLVFLPDTNEIYPNGLNTNINPPQIAELLEGKERPGHFKGVCTVVNILFNIIKPNFVIFGEKDFQQVRVIEDMVNDLKIDTKIIRCPTIRNEMGLALSSRNQRLNPESIVISSKIYEGLNLAKKLVQAGELNCLHIKNKVIDFLNLEPKFRVEYVETVNEQTLLTTAQIQQPARILVAVHIDSVRLIDNLSLLIQN